MANSTTTCNISRDNINQLPQQSTTDDDEDVMIAEHDHMGGTYKLRDSR